jgi:TRAP-type C4-dicarboxylate transport system permease small subunit
MARRIVLAVAALVLPLAFLLFAQWPLRDGLQAGSRQANDAAQVLFAVLMAAGVLQATRSGSHLVAGPALLSPRVASVLVALCLLPWCVFMLWLMAAPVWESLRTLERFPETLDPGYFVIKLAAWCLVVGVLLQSLAAPWRARAPDA